MYYRPLRVPKRVPFGGKCLINFHHNPLLQGLLKGPNNDFLLNGNILCQVPFLLNMAQFV